MDNNIQSVPDRLSDVPDNVITEILARLSMQEAARTSILSKKWRNRWISIPKLVFDETFSSLSNCDLFKIIYRLLLFHPHKITSFYLRVSGLESCVDIDHLMFFLSKHHDVQEFTLDIFGTEECHVISSTLFSFEHLRYLYLSSCVLPLPSVFEGFLHLKSIEFQYVDFQHLNFSRIIEGCPFLEYVVLFDCIHLDSLVVGGPKLKHFDFVGHTWELCFTMSPVLIALELSIDLYTPELKEGGSYVQSGDIIESIAGLPSLNALSMRICIEDSLEECPFFFIGPIPASLPTKLALKTLTLKPVNCESLKEVSLVICLIRSSPDLRELDIQLSSVVGRYDGDAAADFIEAQDFSDTFSNLRYLTMECFKGLKNEIMFLKLVLAKAPHLRDLYVCHENMDVISETRVFESIAQFVGESSPRARFTFDKGMW